MAGIAGVAVALALAGCGSSSGGGGGYGGGSTSATASYGSTSGGTAMPVASRRAIVTTTGGRRGTHLVDAHGRTLYLWLADRGSRSSCAGACAQAWPPLLTQGTARSGRAARASLLGRTMRAGGATQVTYAGHPLYRYAGDTQAGQTAGQGSTAFGAAWYIVSPSGGKITTR